VEPGSDGCGGSEASGSKEDAGAGNGAGWVSAITRLDGLEQRDIQKPRGKTKYQRTGRLQFETNW